MEKTKQIGVRVTEELQKKLKQLADSENRTMSGYIETVLKKAVLASPVKKK